MAAEGGEVICMSPTLTLSEEVDERLAVRQETLVVQKVTEEPREVQMQGCCGQTNEESFLN